MSKKAQILTVGGLLHILKQVANKKAPIVVTDYDGNVTWEALNATKVFDGKTGSKVEEVLIFGDIDVAEGGEDAETPWAEDDEGASCDITGNMTPKQRAELAAYIKEQFGKDCIEDEIKENPKSIIYAGAKDANPKPAT